MSDTMETERLCSGCGMCCDGVLFHTVELQTGDQPRKLSSLGLKIRKQKGVEFFLQPCSAHREVSGKCSCQIYEDRPARCRAFDCRQLRGVLSGEVAEEVALEKIRSAREKVSQVSVIMGQIAETNPNRSLAHRVANALTLPKGADQTPLHDELKIAMEDLEALLVKDFRV
jgi:Fe-S-cluster containining protein